MSRNATPPGGVKQLFAAGAVLLLGLALWHGPLLAGFQVLCGGDLTNNLYPMRHGQLEHGWLSGWAPETFSGRPGLDDIQTGTFYPPNWLHLIHGPLERTFTLLALGHLLLGGIGFFLLCRERLRFAGAIVAAFVWTFGGYQMLRLTNGVLVFNYAFAWVPWIWLAAEKQSLERGPGLRWLVALGFLGAMQIAAGAPQIVQITWVGLGFWTAGRMIWPRSGENRWRTGGGFLAGGILALLLAAPVLLPAWSFQSQAFVRGVEDRWAFLADGSLQPHLVLTWLFPEFHAPGNMEEAYWGSRVGFHETNMFPGLAAVVLALFALLHAGVRLHREVDDRFNYQDNLRWGASLGFLALAGFLVALGENGFLFRPLTALVPTFDYFRVPARWILWPAAAIAIGAGWGIEVLRREASGMPEERRRSVLIAWGASAGALVLLALVLRLFLRPVMEQLGLGAILAAIPPQDRPLGLERLTDYARASTEWGLVVAAGTGIAGAALLLRKAPPAVLLGVILVLGAADLLRFWHPYTHPVPEGVDPRALATEAPYHRIAAGQFHEHFYPETHIVERLRAAPGLGRVHYTDTLLSYLFDHNQRELLMERPAVLGLEVTRGYQQLALRGYTEEYWSSLQPTDAGVAFLSHWEFNDRDFLDAYNVTHVLTYPAPVLVEDLERLGLEHVEVLNADGLELWSNPGARGWAWVSSRQTFLEATPSPARGSVEVLEREAGRWRVRVRAEEPVFVHFASPDHPDWILADAGGVPVERVTSRTFRITEAGEWEFERRWRPGAVPVAVWPLFLIGLALAVAGCAFPAARSRTRQEEGTTTGNAR